MTEGRIVILAGGISSRMKLAGAGRLDPRLAADAEEKAKSMIGVGKAYRPFLDYLLYNCREEGYRDVVIVVSERDTSIREYYGERESGNSFHGLLISYAVQPIPDGRLKPLGTADALLHGLRARPDWRGKKFTVCNSDNLYSRRALRLIREAGGEAALIDYDRAALLFPLERVEQFAVVESDRHGRLRTILEKPSPEEIARVRGPEGRVGVSMNIFGFLYDRILPFLESVPLHPGRQEKELPTAVMMMLDKHPGIMMAIRLAEHVPDLTNRNDLLEVQEYLKREFPLFAW